MKPKKAGENRYVGVKSVLAVDYRSVRVFLKELALPHKYAGKHMFVGRGIVVRDLIAYFYEQPVFVEKYSWREPTEKTWWLYLSSHSQIARSRTCTRL